MDWIWKPQKQEKQEKITYTNTEYTQKQLKTYYHEYHTNKKTIKTLIQNKEILTEQGVQRYKEIKQRQEKLRTILKQNGVTKI